MGRVRVLAWVGLVGVIGGGALLGGLLTQARGFSPLSRVLMASVAAEGPVPPAERPATAEAAEAEAAPRRALLFQRIISEGGAAREGVLEAAFFAEGQVQLRELHTFEKAKSFFVPLGVGQGRVYARDVGDLVVLDLAKGTLELVSNARGEGYVSPPYLYRFQHAENASELKVYDFSRGLERSIPLPEKVPEPVQPALSPDRTKLAYSVPPGWPQERTEQGPPQLPFERHLMVVDLKTGRLERSAQSFRWAPSAFGGSESMYTGLEGVPVRWLDAETLLVLDLVGVEREGGGLRYPPTAYRQIVAYDTKTGTSRVVTRLPGNPISTSFEFVEPGRFDVVRLRGMGASMGVLPEYVLDAQGGQLREDPAQGCVEYRLLESPGGTQLRYGEETLDQAGRFTLVPCLESKQMAWVAVGSRSIRGRVLYYEPGLSEPVEVTQEWVSEHMLWFDPEQLEPSSQPQAAEGWEPIRSAPFPKHEWPPPGSRRIADALTLEVIPEKEVYALHEPVGMTVRLKNVSDTDFEIVQPAPCEDFVELAVRTSAWSRLWGPVRPGSLSLVELRAGEVVELRIVLELPAIGECRVEARLRAYRRALRSQVEWLESPGVRSAEVMVRVEEAPGEAERAAAKVDRLVAQMYAESKGEPNVYTEAGRDLADMGLAAEDRLLVLVQEEGDLSRLHALFGVLERIRSDKVLPFLLPLWQREEPEAKLLALEHLCSFSGREEVRAILLQSLEAQDPKFRRQAAELVSRQWDLALRPAFEKLLTSDDEAVREIAAGYLLALPRVNLEERIGQLLAQEDAVSFALARYLVGQLEGTLHQEKGALPAGSWEEVALNEAARKQYREVLEAWRKWAAENPRTSANFFDRQRGMWRQFPR